MQLTTRGPSGPTRRSHGASGVLGTPQPDGQPSITLRAKDVLTPYGLNTNAELALSEVGMSFQSLSLYGELPVLVCTPIRTGTSTVLYSYEESVAK